MSHTRALCFCISRQVSRHHADFASQSSSSPPTSSPPSSVSSPPKTSAGATCGTSSQLPGRHTAARRLSRDQRSLRGAKGETRKGVSREAAASRTIEERAVDHRLRDMPSEWERPSVVAEEVAVESRRSPPTKSPSNPSKRQTTTTTPPPRAAPSVSFTSSVGARTPPRSRSVPPGGTRANNTSNTNNTGSSGAFMQVRIRIRQCIVQFVACDIVCMHAYSLIWLAFNVSPPLVCPRGGFSDVFIVSSVLVLSFV